jgi:flagellar biosynthesis/type III secretory pathway ATPase
VTTFAPQFSRLRSVQPARISGTVATLRGLTLLVDDLPLPVGSLVSVRSSRPNDPAVTLGEVVGFNREQAIVMLLGQTNGIRGGDRVVGEQAAQSVQAGARVLGRVIDGLGRPLDGKGPIHDTSPMPLSPPPISAMLRRRITEPLLTGVRSVDLMTTLGRGQRMGIFAGPA